MERGLFRDEAVKQLTSPEQLDQRMKLTHRREWFALVAAGLVVLALLFWSIFGQVQTRAAGQAIVLHDGGLVHITASGAGSSAIFNVGENSIVEPGGLVAKYKRTDGTTGEIHSQYSERVQVLEVLVDTDDSFVQGAPLLSVEFVDRPLGGVVYMPSTTGKQVQPGMRVHLVLGSYSVQQYGYLEGVVESVAPFPATAQGMLVILNDPNLVQSILAGTGVGPIVVTIRLIPDPSSPSGFKWSSSKGPKIELSSGLLGQADIVISERRPISLAFP